MLHRKLVRHGQTLGPILSCVAIGFAVLLSSALPASAAELSGCWEGCWVSTTNGHIGKLRATFVKVDDDHFCAHFSGTYQKVLPFRYRVLLSVKQEGDTIKLEGSKDLGLLFGGCFSFDGTATATDFKATYSSRRDCGEFNMKRVQACDCCCR